MDKRQIMKRLCCGALAGMLVCATPVSSWATSSAKAEKEKQEAQKNLNQANAAAQAAESKKNEAQTKVNTLSTKLTDLLTDIQILENDITSKQAEIVQAEKDYEAAKKKEEKQYDSMKKRIQFFYEKGDTEYLDILLQAKSVASLLNKSEYINDIYAYDRNMLISYQEAKDQVAEYEEELKQDKADMETMREEQKDQQKDLEVTISEQRKLVNNFDAQLAQAKQNAAAYAKTVELKTAEIRKAKAAEEAAKKAAEEAARKAAAAKAAAAAKKSQSSNSAPSSSGSSKSNTYSGPSASKSSGGTAAGRAVADYGLQFVGNPYVWGGTSLTQGADCSGFTSSVYSHFGVGLPRTSTEQRSAGRGVSYAEAQPGDLICYSGHVAIYIGNGQIVHAASAKTGIKVSAATYRTILAVRRVL